jgi:hypothetical protein
MPLQLLLSLQFIPIAMVPLSSTIQWYHGNRNRQQGNGHVAIKIWEWQHDNSNMAMAPLQWQHGNNTITICRNRHVAIAMMPLSWTI